MIRLGIIGLGSRISGILNTLMHVADDIKVCAVVDPDKDGAKQKLAENKIKPEPVVFYEDADDMLSKENLDGVLIGTRCSLHAKFAVKVIRKKVPLFLEKPVATNLADLMQLKAAYDKSGSPVVVSFPLRLTTILQAVKEIVDSGKLGSIEHIQAVNNVPYGGIYYHGWYRDENETGGLFLQKATHDFDYINYLLGIRPVAVSAMTSKQIFRGTKPAGMCCADCDDAQTCPESPFSIQTYKHDTVHGPFCCFAEDTGNEDSGSALIRYETGMHVCYSQNFFSRKDAAARGARLIGYDGTLEFDWFTNEIKIFMHNASRNESIQITPSNEGHGGGDFELALSFIRVIRGQAASAAPLEAGLISTLMCLKAREAAESGICQPIE